MMSSEWERYRDRFAAGRPETYDAYVDVWRRIPDAQGHFRSWLSFGQAANAEPKMRRDHPDRVKLASALMAQGGYELGPTTKRGARRWIRAR